jgi:hypothetical protein
LRFFAWLAVLGVLFDQVADHEVRMRDSSLVVLRSESCAVNSLIMTGGEFIVLPHDALRRLGYTQNDTKAGGWAT